MDGSCLARRWNLLADLLLLSYPHRMCTVAEILRAIELLSPDERWQILQELLRRENKEPGAAMPDAFWNRLEELEQGR